MAFMATGAAATFLVFIAFMAGAAATFLALMATSFSSHGLHGYSCRCNLPGFDCLHGICITTRKAKRTTSIPIVRMGLSSMPNPSNRESGGVSSESKARVNVVVAPQENDGAVTTPQFDISDFDAKQKYTLARVRYF